MRSLSLLFLLLSPSILLSQSSIAPTAPYTEVTKSLDAFIAAQVDQHHLPAVSIALIDDQKIVWAKGFGLANPQRKTAATAETVYRVGSVSKLFTDLAVMQLVEKGVLDLDAPVTKYFPSFQPKNPFGKDAKPITLRQLMAHRSGLLREPQVGNYFDADNDSLEKMVQSLNSTTLVHLPESTTKYSNAGIAVVGHVLEKTRKVPFVQALSETILSPMGMKSSSFMPTPAIKKQLAKAIMWTYQGREFPAPTFELGMAPAGCMYSTVLDLGRFQQMLFNRGVLDGKRIVSEKTLESMWKPQFVKDDVKEGFGLGFFVRQWQGKRRIGHGGAIYGFATDLSCLPDDKLGVVVIISCDCANAVASRIADMALSFMVAAKEKKPLPTIEKTTPLTAADAKKFAGRYESEKASFELIRMGDRLYFFSGRGGYRIPVARLGDALMPDGRLSFGPKLEPTEDGFRSGKLTFKRVETKKPAEVSKSMRGLIGEYGPDHLPVLVFEKDGKLYVQIEWFFTYPLEKETEDIYLFPKSFGLYSSEKLTFTRDKTGRAVKVVAASMEFPRRKIVGEDGGTFKIKPLHPVNELRKTAMKAKPPVEAGILFRNNDLVELVSLDNTLKLDIRYATTNNFLGTPLYLEPRAFMQRPAAEALVRVNKKLRPLGYGLMIFDGYRPWTVTKMFWDATPASLKVFVADPKKGSRHNRGCAVDLTLYDLKTGKPIEMVGGYDEMSDRSYPEYHGGTSLQRMHRELLRDSMEAEGFAVYEAEWWHFDYKDWRKYPIGNATFAEIGKKK